jgi:glutamine amidotransferase
MFQDVDNNALVYLVNSYYSQCLDENTIAYSDYCGHKFAAAIRRNNVMGMQFHPEKSKEIDLKILKNFGEL